MLNTLILTFLIFIVDGRHFLFLYVTWYIFSKFLIDGKKAIFTNKTVSYYRQHEQNTIGLKQFDESSFNKALNVKIKHQPEILSINVNFEFHMHVNYSCQI